MNNPGIRDEIWSALREKWAALDKDGHVLRVDFNILKAHEADAEVLAIDVAQNIDGAWHVQTVQHKAREGYASMGIDGLGLDSLIYITSQAVNSVTEPVIGKKSFDDEMHLFMKRISLDSSEITGYVVSAKGEKISVRANYHHYYLMNEILEQITGILKEQYSEIQLHRNKNDYGRIYFGFVHA